MRAVCIRLRASGARISRVPHQTVAGARWRLGSSLCEKWRNQRANLQAGTVQLARTRDTPRQNNRTLRTFVEHRTQLIILHRVRRALAVLSSTTMGGPFHRKTRQQATALRRLVARALCRRALVACLAASRLRAAVIKYDFKRVGQRRAHKVAMR